MFRLKGGGEAVNGRVEIAPIDCVLLNMSKPEFSRGKSKTFKPFNRAFSALYNALQLRSECAELKRD